MVKPYRNHIYLGITKCRQGADKGLTAMGYTWFILCLVIVDCLIRIALDTLGVLVDCYY